ncbi:MAG TPA: selenium-dependent molybdenum cofactor biosynthesis protein YqeB [Ktedonobacteraceae bacterium]|nr:selenium-dependent molybdenum cofactor biosynthesis protein YqeB [Ktedonobacteraceae bacterium]
MEQTGLSTSNNFERSVRLPLVMVKGAGDLATGVIHRLFRAGFPVMATELPQPTVLRRTVAFAEAVAQGEMTVEGLTAHKADSVDDAKRMLTEGLVPVLVDPEGVSLRELRPGVLVEATLAKRNTGISTDTAPIVVALGPGYEAGKDAHAVIETNRGHNLGRVYLTGYAEPNTGTPGTIGGYGRERLLRAPCDGRLYSIRQIGDRVAAGETVAEVKSETQFMPVISAIDGILRGLVRDGLKVTGGMKIGDVDPRAVREHCFTISDKSRAVAGGVLEAVMYFLHAQHTA